MSPTSLPQRTFKRLLVRSVVLPAILLAVLAGVLVWQITRLLSNTGWVEHSDQVITKLNELRGLHVDMETGLRGYLLTGDAAFSAPFTHGSAQVDPAFTLLDQLLSDQLDQQRRLDAIRALKDRWVAFARKQIASKRAGGSDWQDPVKAGAGKDLMDGIRRRFAALISAEERIRSRRSAAVQRAARMGVGLACGLALLIGAVLSILSIRQLRMVSASYEKALANSAELSANLEKRVAERTDELAAANASLAEANKELEAFTYSISHDLRAPMRHIAGFADLLGKSIGARLDPDDAENLATIHETARLAGRMVDDLLGFSRVGRTQLTLAPVNVTELVEQARRELEPETRGREIHWQIHELPHAWADRTLLKLAIQNLAANAVKYTSGRHVAEIEVGARPEDGGATYWIKDNGVGFDMAYAHKLFGVFQRLHRPEDFEGTGIGLANVRRIILRHGGRVWAEGQSGVGAAFFFWLPTMEKGGDERHETDTSGRG